MKEANRDPKLLYPAFREKIEIIVAEVNAYCLKHCPQWKVELGEGYRSTVRQRLLYTQGRTTPGNIVTKIDGVKSISSHQTCLAMDLWFRRNGKITWQDIPWTVLQYYGHCCRAQGLVWGGDWDGDQKSSDEKFVDGPHCEWPRKDKATYAKAKAWKKQEGLK